MHRRNFIGVGLLTLTPAVDANASALKELMKACALILATEGSHAIANTVIESLRPKSSSFELLKAIELLDVISNPNITAERLRSVIAPKIDFYTAGVMTADEYVRAVILVRSMSRTISYQKPKITEFEIQADRKFAAATYSYTHTFESRFDGFKTYNYRRVALLGDFNNGGLVYALKQK